MEKSGRVRLWKSFDRLAGMEDESEKTIRTFFLSIVYGGISDHGNPNGGLSARC